MGYELPTPAQRGLGLALLDAGATLVIGCHPHVLQGVVARPGVLLAHSLGDFAFYPEKADGKPVDQHRVRQTGALLTVDVDGHGVAAHQLILTRQRGTGIGLETSASRRRSVERRGDAPGAADPGTRHCGDATSCGAPCRGLVTGSRRGTGARWRAAL